MDKFWARAYLFSLLLKDIIPKNIDWFVSPIGCKKPNLYRLSLRGEKKTKDLLITQKFFLKKYRSTLFEMIKKKCE